MYLLKHLISLKVNTLNQYSLTYVLMVSFLRKKTNCSFILHFLNLRLILFLFNCFLNLINTKEKK